MCDTSAAQVRSKCGASAEQVRSTVRIACGTGSERRRMCGAVSSDYPPPIKHKNTPKTHKNTNKDGNITKKKFALTRLFAGARADPLRIRGEDCGTAAAPVRHRCGTGAEPVRIACGTGAERVRNAGGTGAERRRNGCGTPADLRRGVL